MPILHRPRKKFRAVNKASYTANYSDVLSYSIHVGLAMSNNVVTFPSPPYSYLLLQSRVLTLATELTNYTNNPSKRTSAVHLLAIKKAARRVQTIIRGYTHYVNTVAQGDPVKIHLAGMATNKEFRNRKKLSAVDNFRQLISPKVPPGHIQISWHKPKGTKTRKGISYRIELTTQQPPVGIVELGISTKTFFTFDGNLYGPNPHYVRVTPVNGAVSPWLTVNGQF